MRKSVCPLVIAACLLVAAFAPLSAAIYGEDDRLENFEAKKSYRTYARSVAAIVPLRNLAKTDTGYRWRFDRIPRLMDREISGKRIDRKERFAQQRVLGVGTAFLIAPDTIVTAGHCIVNAKGALVVREMAIVFDCAIDPATQAVPPNVPAANVYRCTSAVTVKLDKIEGQDFAIVRLDRPVTGRVPLSVRKTGTIADGTRLVLIGHPLGLPSKIAANARVRKNDDKNFFVADLDAFPGSSGSPVLDAKSGMVEGILVRGPKSNWRFDPIRGRLLVRHFETADAAKWGTHVQRINRIPEIARGLTGGSALFDLIASGKTDAVLETLGTDKNYLARDRRRRSLMHQAMLHRNIEVAQKLIALEAPLLVRDESGGTPLHEAARVGFLAGAKLLVDNDLPVNAITNIGETALHIASERNDEAMVAYLKEQGGDPKIKPNPSLRFVALPKERPERWLEYALTLGGSGSAKPAPNASGGRVIADAAWVYAFLGQDARAKELIGQARSATVAATTGTHRDQALIRICETLVLMGRRPQAVELAKLVSSEQQEQADRIVSDDVTRRDAIQALKGNPIEYLRRIAGKDSRLSEDARFERWALATEESVRFHPLARAAQQELLRWLDEAVAATDDPKIRSLRARRIAPIHHKIGQHKQAFALMKANSRMTGFGRLVATGQFDAAAKWPEVDLASDRHDQGFSDALAKYRAMAWEFDALMEDRRYFHVARWSVWAADYEAMDKAVQCLGSYTGILLELSGRLNERRQKPELAKSMTIAAARIINKKQLRPQVADLVDRLAEFGMIREVGIVLAKTRSDYVVDARRMLAGAVTHQKIDVALAWLRKRPAGDERARAYILLARLLAEHSIRQR